MLFTFITNESISNSENSVLLDVDECRMSTYDCHPMANCVNTPGGYSCVCQSGYAGNGSNCKSSSKHFFVTVYSKIQKFNNKPRLKKKNLHYTRGILRRSVAAGLLSESQSLFNKILNFGKNVAALASGCSCVRCGQPEH